MTLALADLGELLQLLPVQRAGFALLLAAMGLPVIGVVIVGLDIMPVRFAMMHVALLGIAVGLLTGLDPMLCALVACALAGAGVAPLARTPDGLSGAMGLLMSLAIAAALLLLAVSGVNASGAFALLVGSILSVGTPDLVVLGLLAVLVPGLFWWRRREIGLLLYDRELAQCSGVPVRGLTRAAGPGGGRGRRGDQTHRRAARRRPDPASRTRRAPPRQLAEVDHPVGRRHRRGRQPDRLPCGPVAGLAARPGPRPDGGGRRPRRPSRPRTENHLMARTRVRIPSLLALSAALAPGDRLRGRR